MRQLSGNGHIEDESELLCLDMEHILEYVYNERAKKNGQIVHGHNECQCKRHFSGIAVRVVLS